MGVKTNLFVVRVETGGLGSPADTFISICIILKVIYAYGYVLINWFRVYMH